MKRFLVLAVAPLPTVWADSLAEAHARADLVWAGAPDGVR
jgi:hypothetical protein